MKAASGSQAYLRTKVLTASPAELRLMLIDGAIRFTELAKTGYERKDYEATYEGTTKAQAILLELVNSLRPDQSPALCESLSALYTYMYQRLLEASVEKSSEIVAEVLKLLRFERETWVLCMDELARENHAASGVTEIPRTAAPSSHSDSAELPRPRLSVQI